MSVIIVLSVIMVAAYMLLSTFFVSGVLADCRHYSSLSITTPKKMEALSGSCLQIPCKFNPKSEEEVNGRGETFGVWIKNDSRFGDDPSNVIFNSSEKVHTYPMSLTGNLPERNCTTLFSGLLTSYTDSYFFRIENEPFKATAICDPLQITVNDFAPSPRIEVSDDLKEKESVTITCSAVTPCPHAPPKLTWNLRQDSHHSVEENTDGTFTSKIQETITLSDRHDGYNISCSVRYPVNEGKDFKRAEERKTLRVSYAPKDTLVSVSPSGLVSAGSLVNLSCSSRARPPVTCFTWSKVNKDGAMRVSEGYFYSFNATDGGTYLCVASNELGNQTSSLFHLKFAENSNRSSKWGSALGGIAFLICLGICFWRFRSKHQTQQQSQSGGELPPSKTEENIYYGEIDFSKLRPKPSSESTDDREEQQETLYAQVNVSGRANNLRPTADGPEDVSAQVWNK